MRACVYRMCVQYQRVSEYLFGCFIWTVGCVHKPGNWGPGTVCNVFKSIFVYNVSLAGCLII